MKISEYKETYEYFSGKLSDINRSLVFMGFGVVWILSGGLENFKQGVIPIELIWVMIGFVLTLILDLAHYVYQTIIWHCYFIYLEKRFGKHFKKDLCAPKRFNRWGWCFFWVKVIVMFITYIYLIRYIFLLLF